MSNTSTNPSPLNETEGYLRRKSSEFRKGSLADISILPEEQTKTTTHLPPVGKSQYKEFVDPKNESRVPQRRNSQPSLDRTENHQKSIKRSHSFSHIIEDNPITQLQSIHKPSEQSSSNTRASATSIAESTAPIKEGKNVQSLSSMRVTKAPRKKLTKQLQNKDEDNNRTTNTPPKSYTSNRRRSDSDIYRRGSPNNEIQKTKGRSQSLVTGSIELDQLLTFQKNTNPNNDRINQPQLHLDSHTIPSKKTEDQSVQTPLSATPSAGYSETPLKDNNYTLNTPVKDHVDQIEGHTPLLERSHTATQEYRLESLDESKNLKKAKSVGGVNIFPHDERGQPPLRTSGYGTLSQDKRKPLLEGPGYEAFPQTEDTNPFQTGNDSATPVLDVNLPINNFSHNSFTNTITPQTYHTQGSGPYSFSTPTRTCSGSLPLNSNPFLQVDGYTHDQSMQSTQNTNPFPQTDNQSTPQRRHSSPNTNPFSQVDNQSTPPRRQSLPNNNQLSSENNQSTPRRRGSTGSINNSFNNSTASNLVRRNSLPEFQHYTPHMLPPTFNPPNVGATPMYIMQQPHSSPYQNSGSGQYLILNGNSNRLFTPIQTITPIVTNSNILEFSNLINNQMNGGILYNNPLPHQNNTIYYTANNDSLPIVIASYPPSATNGIVKSPTLGNMNEQDMQDVVLLGHSLQNYGFGIDDREDSQSTAPLTTNNNQSQQSQAEYNGI